jgi:RNA-binding motif X-linked protein 2
LGNPKDSVSCAMKTRGAQFWLLTISMELRLKEELSVWTMCQTQESEDVDDMTRELQEKGCGVKTPPSSPPEVSEDEDAKLTKKHKKEKKKRKKEKTERQVQAEQPSCSRSTTVKEKKDEHASRKHSSKTSERAQKSEHRESKKSHSGSPGGRSSYHARAEDPECKARKEKPKQEHKSASRREAEEKSRERERGRSSLIPAGTGGILMGGAIEVEVGIGVHRHSPEQESYHGSDRRHH